MVKNTSESDTNADSKLSLPKSINSTIIRIIPLACLTWDLHNTWVTFG